MDYGHMISPRLPRFWMAAFGAAVLSQIAANADVRLHTLFTDHMVLQRDISVPVWGWADEGEEVVVRFRDQTVKTKAKDGHWLVRLSRLKAGGPDALSVQGKNQIELKDVLVGEVMCP